MFKKESTLPMSLFFFILNGFTLGALISGFLFQVLIDVFNLKTTMDNHQPSPIYLVSFIVFLVLIANFVMLMGIYLYDNIFKTNYVDLLAEDKNKTTKSKQCTLPKWPLTLHFFVGAGHVFAIIYLFFSWYIMLYILGNYGVEKDNEKYFIAIYFFYFLQYLILLLFWERLVCII